MSGIFTDSRGGAVVYNCTLTPVGAGPVTFVADTVISDQETTSYRSGQEDFEAELQAFGQVTSNPLTGTGVFSKVDGGHEFQTVKRQHTLNKPKVDLKYPGSYPWARFQGALVPISTGSLVVGYPTVPPLDISDVKYYGTKAIAQTIPTNPASNLSQALGEIVVDKELPQVKTMELAGIAHYKGRLTDIVSKGYLSYVFAFAPASNDVRKLMIAVQNSYKIISQFKRDAGRQVRRRYRFDDVIEDGQTTVSNSNIPYLNSFDLSGSSWDAIYTQYVRKETWFSGSYLYHLPVDNSLLGKMEYFNSLANRVLGSDFTPETIWKLAPWSWLVDWFANISDVFHNTVRMQDDNLVLRYGYLMRRTTAVNQFTIPGVRFEGRRLGPVTRTFSVVRKERWRATPYGFGLNPQSFSEGQWAILTALGISKGSKTLGI
jgi:hypothetical protein